ncbi:MAG: hypothetical protein M1820_003437 [Bogoriella megaspora]|nr:MAG: hypothetical protein M1820_003437 [Bogoriella megaspora]
MRDPSNFNLHTRSSHNLNDRRRTAAFVPDDFPSLDCGAQDNASSVMSPSQSHFRRESFQTSDPDSATMYSPDAGGWDGPSASGLERNSNPMNPFYESQTNNPFTRMDASQQAVYGQQPWSFENESGTCTPTVSTYDHFGQDFDTESHAPFSAGIEPSNMSSNFGGMQYGSNVRPSSVFQGPPANTPMSPQAPPDWMNLASQEAESRPYSREMRRASPALSQASALRRRAADGGIRKKNARFDIPEGRTLDTIDDLIKNCTNEADLKELKSQKRLLRNRQAALDSRSRKKQYTKELEIDKKMYMEEISGQKDAIDELTRQLERLKVEREREYMESQEIIRNLQFEREELVASNTLETGDLRKRISLLTERLESATMPMSAAPSSTGFNDLGIGMESLNMCQDWEWMVDPNGMQQDSNAHVAPHGIPNMNNSQDNALVSSRKVDEDKAVPTGLLLMLLLCGAFVASKSAGQPSPSIRMPDDVRVASATVLDNIFKDAGVTPTSSSTNLAAAHRVSGLEPHASAGPSGVNGNTRWLQKSHTITGSEFARLTNPSALDSLHHELTATTKDQEAEQLFSMTPALYNSLTAHHDLSHSLHSPPLTNEDTSPSPTFGGGRKVLADTLASMREQSRENAAQVYTRSLLWDEVPRDVVREFKRIVEGSGGSMGKHEVVMKSEG